MTRKAGRPRAEIDGDLVERLASIMCTEEEIAQIVGVDRSTINRHFAQAIKEAQSKGKWSLRRAQWKSAVEDGNATMQIWLGKQWLGQTDRHEVGGSDDAKPVRVLIDWVRADTSYTVDDDDAKEE